MEIDENQSRALTILADKFSDNPRALENLFVTPVIVEVAAMVAVTVAGRCGITDLGKEEQQKLVGLLKEMNSIDDLIRYRSQ